MNIQISKWWWPVIGAALGYCVGSGAKELGDDWRLEITSIGLLIGICCLFVGGAPKTVVQSGENKNEKASVIGIVLSIAALLLFFLPMGIGLVISLAALVVNWRVKGAIKILTWTAFVLSVLSTLFFCAMIIGAGGN